MCENEVVVEETTSNDDSLDLSTINIEALSDLREEEDQTIYPGQQNSGSQDIGEELIGTCVTPSKIKTVRQTMERESERHLCALKLLPCFFSRDELATSNTDGSHDKKCLDGNKLNSLKVLVFSKFPVGSSAEKDKMWRAIKAKINSKCRAAKRLTKDFSNERSL